MKKLGVIDLGSNTTRLIVMAYEPGHCFRLTDEVSETVRLAEGIGPARMLQPAPIRRAVEALRMFYSLCVSTGVDQVIAVGTSAIREAANQADFWAALRESTHLIYASYRQRRRPILAILVLSMPFLCITAHYSILAAVRPK